MRDLITVWIVAVLLQAVVQCGLPVQAWAEEGDGGHETRPAVEMAAWV